MKPRRAILALTRSHYSFLRVSTFVRPRSTRRPVLNNLSVLIDLTTHVERWLATSIVSWRR